MEPARILESKKRYRKLLRNRLLQMRARERLSKSRIIAHQLFSDSSFQKARNILCYAALPTEVQTRLILKEGLRRRKKMYLPVISESGRSIQIYRMTHFAFIRGLYGIPEPPRRLRHKGKLSELDLVIVPGLGFDKRGYRIGRGAGYFDRLLAKSKKAFKIGLAYREQIVGKVPVLPHDIRMHRVLTD